MPKHEPEGPQNRREIVGTIHSRLPSFELAAATVGKLIVSSSSSQSPVPKVDSYLWTLPSRDIETSIGYIPNLEPVFPYDTP